jgi:hypothetical protein
LCNRPLLCVFTTAVFILFTTFDVEKTVKTEIEALNGTEFHKYGYKPAAFGTTDGVKALSAKAVDAIKAALENAGK